MSFDTQDILEANEQLLQEAAGLSEPASAVLVCVATWGRGADPELLNFLQPYRHGLGFNGSVVARVPRELALEKLPAEVAQQCQEKPAHICVCATVAKDWTVEHWPL